MSQYANMMEIFRKNNQVIKKYVDSKGVQTTEEGGETFNHLDNEARGEYSHAEGRKTAAIGDASHAEGTNIPDNNEVEYIHEYKYTDPEGVEQVIQIHGPRAEGKGSHAEGSNTYALGHSAHAEGCVTEAIGGRSHAEGTGTKAIGSRSHAEGGNTITEGIDSHAEGSCGQTVGRSAHVEGYHGGYDAEVVAYYDAEEDGTLKWEIAKKHKEKQFHLAHGRASHVEGVSNLAFGEGSHAEGQKTQALGNHSHSEGRLTTARGDYSHAEGFNTKTIWSNQHVEGKYNDIEVKYTETQTSGTISAAKDKEAFIYFDSVTRDDDNCQFILNNPTESRELPPNNTTTCFTRVKNVLGDNTTREYYQFFETDTKKIEEIKDADGNITGYKGPYMVYKLNCSNYAHVIGNGTSTKRSNAHTVDWSGNAWFAGDVTVGPDKKRVLTKDDVKDGLFVEVTLPGDAKAGETYEGVVSHSSMDMLNTMRNGEAVYVCFTNHTWIDDGSAEIFSGAVHTPSKWLEDLVYISISDTYRVVLGNDQWVTIEHTPHVHVGDTQGAHGEIFNDYLNNTAGSYSHAEGKETSAIGYSAHAEGEYTIAEGQASHAEGDSIKRESVGGNRNAPRAYGRASHAEGTGTIAGVINDANICASHAEGVGSQALETAAHAEGFDTKASGKGSHTEGMGTVAVGLAQHVEGEYNKADTIDKETKKGKYIHIAGNGSSGNPSNAHTLDWNGNGWFAGNLYVGGNDQTDGQKVATVNGVQNEYVNYANQQELSPEQRARARENIGALAANDDIDLNGYDIINVENVRVNNCIVLKNSYHGDPEVDYTDIAISTEGGEFDNNDKYHPVIGIRGDNSDEHAILRYIADGIYEHDAVNKKQLDAAIAHLNAVEVRMEELEDLPYKYLEGTVDQPIILRELVNGIYYIKGYVQYHHGADIYRTSTGLFVVQKLTDHSQLVRFAPEADMLRYYTIRDNTWESYAVELSNISAALDKISSLENKINELETKIEDYHTPSFYFNGVKFMFDEGMTWGQWVNSEYNTTGIDGDYTTTYISYGYLTSEDLVFEDQNGNYQLENDKILNKHRYKMSDTSIFDLIS